jgi:hypothetical protein
LAALRHRDRGREWKRFLSPGERAKERKTCQMQAANRG